MSDDKPTGTGTTVVNNDPWSGQRPYLSKGFATAEQFLNNPVQAYPNSTVVPQHSATTQALSGIRDRATSGSSLLRSGQDTIGAAARGDYIGQTPGSEGLRGIASGDYIGQTPGTQGLQDTASGAYLDGNPHLQGIIDKAIRTSRAATDAQFAGSGRYGSGLHKGMAQDRMAEITSGVLAPAYESERNRMFNAQGSLANIGGAERSAQFGAQGSLANIGGSERSAQLGAAQQAPGMANYDYGDLERLGSVGGAFEAQGQAELQDRINRFQIGQQAPRDALREYMATIGGGSAGGRATTTAPTYSDSFGKYLSYGAKGAGIAGSLFGKDGVFS